MAQPQFQLGNLVPSDKLYGRKREIRRLVNRICSGQSSGLVGDPRTGKTSLLHFISAKTELGKLYGDQAGKLIFCYLDAETFSQNLDQSGFWKLVFDPVEKLLVKGEHAAELEAIFRNWQGNELRVPAIEKLLAHMQRLDMHLVLLLDEFDAVLNHPILNQAEFYGSLRSLASRFGSTFTLVTASRQSIGTLNELTQDFYKYGSPYFNFLDEITLSNLSDKEVEKFLTETCAEFEPRERKFILSLTGGHPYMMQISAASLWEVDQEEKQGPEELNLVVQDLIKKFSTVLNDTWRLWAPDVRKAFAIVALDAMPRLLGKHEFDISALRASLNDCKSELRFLEQRGYICQDRDIICGWRVNGNIQVMWLAEVLTNSLRKRDDLGQFLLQQSWDGLFKAGEKEQLFRAVSKLSILASGGTFVLTKIVVEKLMEGPLHG